MPTRQATAAVAVESILPNVDKLYIYLDRFESLPSFAIHPKIIPIHRPDEPSIGANGKFLGLGECQSDDYYVCFDDDLKYPKNFTRWLMKQATWFSGPVVVGIHGCRFISNVPLKSYASERKVYRGQRVNVFPSCLHVMATNGCLWRAGDLQFDLRNWFSINQCDLNFAFEAASRDVRFRLSLKRPRWVTVLDSGQPDSIYRQLLIDDREQTILANQLIEKMREKGNQSFV